MIAIDESVAWTLGLITFVLFLVLYVWTALALGAVFRKSGEAAWKGWVPFLNQATLFRLGGLSGWLVLLWFLPIFGALIVWVAQIVACHRINQEFGFGGGMTVLAALLLPVWASVVGFGSARWVGRETGAGPLRARASDDADIESDNEPEAAVSPAPYSPITPPPAYGPAYSRAAPDVPRAATISAAPAVTGAASNEPPRQPGPTTALPAGIWGPPQTAAEPSAPPVAPITAAPTASSSSVDASDAPEVPEVSPRYAAPAGVPEPAASAPASSAPAAPTSPATAPQTISAAAVPAAVFPVHKEQLDDAVDSSAPGEPFDEDDDAENAGPRRSRSWAGGYDQEDPAWEVTSAVEGAPAPVSAIPPAPSASEMPPVGVPRSLPDDRPGEQSSDEVAPAEPQRPAVTRVPAAPAPDRSREPWGPLSDPEAFPETSGPVSAVVGAPIAGGPRSARTSVSSFHTRPEIPDESIDETIIARRRRTHWSLVLPSGDPVAIGSETVLLGRRPVADPAHPGAQLVAVDDGTVSKTHARLDLRDDRWYITDLGSTNGVVFTTLTGTDVEVPTGVEIEAGDLFILGDAEVRLVRSDG